jgi:hypothetical protein
MGGAIAGGDRVDMLIVTAVKEEYDAVLAVRFEARVGAIGTCSKVVESSRIDALWPLFLALPAAHERLARIAVYQDISPKGDPEGRQKAINLA